MNNRQLDREVQKIEYASKVQEQHRRSHERDKQVRRARRAVKQARKSINR